ncbi:MAG: threonine ammonia-lyase [Microbacteriaceae bacterium]|nr:threonine ammonia-lyase [Microbacteriaceae bacterium]
MAKLPDYDAVVAAESRISPSVKRTPVLTAQSLSGITGVTMFIKCENLQRTGSYKLRGALNRLSQLSDEQRSKGVVAASAGNHAQGVALAAKELGIQATIYMPVGAALPKMQATKGYGAKVVLEGIDFDRTLEAALKFADETGAIFIPPFDHYDIIAGQGTVGLEILEQIDDFDYVLVPVGGGGLISGIATAIKAKKPGVKIIGVQSGSVDVFARSFKSKKRLSQEIRPTIADGIAVGHPGELTFEAVCDLVDDFVTVTEDEIAEAILLTLERSKILVEPAGAVGFAALLSGKLEGIVEKGSRVVVVATGGNIDPLLLQRVVSHGLETAGRYLKLRIPLPDLPGQLAETSKIVAQANGNVVEVQHTRHGSGLQISDVELELHIETRGPEHAENVMQALRDHGYNPKVVA